MAARNPLGNRSIIIDFAILFTMRGLQRLLYMDEIESVFAIPREPQPGADGGDVVARSRVNAASASRISR